MDKNKEKCDSIGLKYKQKYDKLLSLVNGYENQNINVSKEQQKNMKQLADIISNTKELLSESEFTKLRNEQDNIMKEFYHLENVKNDNPYSNNALEFTNNSDIIDESLNNISEYSDENNNSTEENNSDDKKKSNSAIDKLKNTFSLDSFENINNKTNTLADKKKSQTTTTTTNETHIATNDTQTSKNETQTTKNQQQIITNEVRKDLERNDTIFNNSIETQSNIQQRRNDVLNSTIESKPKTSIIQSRPVNMPVNMQQPCYPNKPNFIGLPSIQIVNVESSCQSKRKSSSKHHRTKKISSKNRKPKKQEVIKKIPSRKKRKIKKDGPKCHRENYVPTFKDKSNNHKIFNS